MTSMVARFKSSGFFYLSGHLKSLLTTKRYSTVALWMPASLSATTSNGRGGPWWDVSRRALNLMEDIWSTYYKCSLSTKNQEIIFFRTHVDMDIFSSFGTWNSCPKFFGTFQLHSVNSCTNTQNIFISHVILGHLLYNVSLWALQIIEQFKSSIFNT
jgi:hypothetical protein